MHHASEESQQVYTQATTREAIAALEAAAQRLRAQHAKTPFAPAQPLPGIELDE